MPTRVRPDRQLSERTWELAGNIIFKPVVWDEKVEPAFDAVAPLDVGGMQDWS